MQPTGDGQNLMAFLLDAANRRLIKGERIGAGVLLDEVLQIAPENVVARLSLAKLRLRDSPSTASFLAQRVVEAAPNDADPWLRSAAELEPWDRVLTEAHGRVRRQAQT